MATTLKQDLVKLRKLKNEATELDTKAKKAGAERDKFMAAVYARMERDDIDSVKAAGGTFVRSATVRATVQDRETFVLWAKANDPGLIQDKEQGTLLNQLVRERIDNGEELPPGIGFYAQEMVGVRAG